MAVCVVSVIYNNAVSIGCVSHNLDIVGDKFITPILSMFSTLWISLFAHSHKARAFWKEQTGRAMNTLSKTRWWSRWEIYEQLMVQF